MADYFILIESASGRAISQTADADWVANFSRPGLEFVTVDKATMHKAAWNPDTRQFDPLPEVRIIDKVDFLELFTDDEIEGIIVAERTNPKVAVFLKKLEMAAKVDMKSQRMIRSINGLSQLGLIAANRVAVILNG